MALYKRNRDLVVNSVDLTAWVVSIGCDATVATQPTTTTGSTNRTYGQGLPDYTLTARMLNSLTASQTWLTLVPLLTDDDGVTVTAQSTSGNTVGQVSGSMILESMPLITDGDPDEVDEITVVFKPSGTIIVSTT